MQLCVYSPAASTDADNTPLPHHCYGKLWKYFRVVPEDCKMYFTEYQKIVNYFGNLSPYLKTLEGGDQVPDWSVWRQYLFSWIPPFKRLSHENWQGVKNTTNQPVFLSEAVGRDIFTQTPSFKTYNDSASHTQKFYLVLTWPFFTWHETLVFWLLKKTFVLYIPHLWMLCMPTQCMPKLHDKIIFDQFVHIQAMQRRFYVGINISMATDAIS
jgi:hypothetical protein